MKKLASTLTILALLLVINSCKKNEISATDIIVPYEPGATVTTAVAGKVTNQNGEALNGVTITIGSTTVMTDAEGQFIIPKAILNQNAGLIKATKAGYFAGSRTIRPKEKVVNNIVIQLVKKTLSSSFINASGGTITVTTGGSIVFPANAVVTKSGAAYTGSVKVASYFLDPTSNNCSIEMPGDLRGINTNNNEQVLTSYGMMAVELQGSNGEALQMASGKKATITFPIAAATQSTAPANIPLWFFDETKGLWVEEGSATKTGNNYVGDVAHFTWWNCDYGGGPITLTAKFVDQNGNVLDNYLVYFITPTGWGGGGGSGYTASDGSITGNIPANKSIVAKIINKNKCNNSYATLLDTTLGSFTQNTNLGTITVNIANFTSTTITIKGTVNDCSNAAIANGYTLIKLANGSYYYTQINNGSFSKTITYCSAVPATTATVTVFDLNTLKQNVTPINVNITGAGTFNVGAVQACGVQNFIRYTATLIDQFGNNVSPSLNGYSGFQVKFNGDTMISNYPTNSSFSFIIPSNKIMTRTIYVNTLCSSWVLVDSTQIGPFTTDFNAGIISVTVPQPTSLFTISGTANDCNGVAIANGVATIILENRVYKGTVSNGSFAVNVSRCGTAVTDANITVSNSALQQQNSTSALVSVSNTNINVGTIQACGVSSNEFINFDFDSTTASYGDTLNCTRDNSGITSIIAYNANNFKIWFQFSQTNPGTYKAQLFSIYKNNVNYSTNATQTVTVTTTEYGSVGQFVAGSFVGSVRTTNGTAIIKQISGSFRIKRTQ